MLLPNRHGSSDSYRYGFNGMEKDDEIKGIEGSAIDFGARMYDPRIGRWFSLDPLDEKYPEFSPYNYVANNPIVYIDPDGKEIILGLFISGELLKKFNAVIKKMNKSGIFKQLYTTLDNHKEVFVINKVQPTQYNKLLTENGDFTRRREVRKDWFGIVEYQPGEKGNAHTISLVEPGGGSQRGFNQSVIFEEIFHANQYIDSPETTNKLEIETEAKVAKVFQLYNQIIDKIDEMGEVLKESKNFGLSSYELKLLIDTNDKNEAIGINKNVKSYFDALINDTEISDKMKKLFRDEVKKLGDRVNKRYEKHWGGKKFENTGDTPLFDKLSKG
jgi:RHS repeat-associated protein